MTIALSITKCHVIDLLVCGHLPSVTLAGEVKPLKMLLLCEVGYAVIRHALLQHHYYVDDRKGSGNVAGNELHQQLIETET